MMMVGMMRIMMLMIGPRGDDADEIVALATSCIVVKCTLDAEKDAHSLKKLPNHFCKQITQVGGRKSNKSRDEQVTVQCPKQVI